MVPSSSNFTECEIHQKDKEKWMTYSCKWSQIIQHGLHYCNFENVLKNLTINWAFMIQISKLWRTEFDLRISERDAWLFVYWNKSISIWFINGSLGSLIAKQIWCNKGEKACWREGKCKADCSGKQIFRIINSFWLIFSPPFAKQSTFFS